MSDRKPKRQVVAAQCSDHPARRQIAGQLDELIAVENQADAEIRKLEAHKQQARTKFLESTKPEVSPAEELTADMEATVDRANSYQSEHEAELRAKEFAEDESNRDQIVEEVVALAERTKQLKNRAKLRETISAPIKTIQSGIFPAAHADTRKAEKVKLALPLQFDYKNRILIDRNKQPSVELPLRFVDVLRAWFAHGGVNQKQLKLKLSYEEIGVQYLRGRIKKKVPAAATEADIQSREELFQGGKIGNSGTSKRKYATRFASDFTRWLDNNCSVAGKDLFFNDERAGRYLIKRSGWHPTRPMINRAEETRRPHYKSHQQNAEDRPDND